jgi:type IV pilus assembly protein PilM
MFGKRKSIAGLDVGSSSIKMVELEGRADNFGLVSLGLENLPSDTIIDGQIMELTTVSDTIRNLCVNYGVSANQVVTGVSGHSVIIKNIVLPPMSRGELEESIDWHAEEHIPYDLADVSLDYQVTAETHDATHVLIAACKRERIDNMRQAIQLSGRQAVVIDVDTFALQNCYENNYQPRESDVVTLLNIGASTMNVNIVRGSRSIFTRDITVGGSQFTDVLQRSLGISYQQAEAVKRGVQNAAKGVEEKSIEPLMSNVTEIVANEIQKTFDFYRATTDDNQTVVQKILISGGGSKLSGLAAELSARLELPVEVLNPFRNIKVDNRKFDPAYVNEIMPEMAVAVGLAMRGV